MIDRLQKKCFIGSAGIHLLLAVILVIGPAFVVQRSKPQMNEIPLIDYVPVVTTFDQREGGGKKDANSAPPAAAQSPPQAPPPASQPKQQEVQTPAEPAKEVHPQKAEEPSLEPSPKPTKPKKPAIDLNDLKPVKRDSRQRDKQKAEAEANAANKQWADNQRRLKAAIGEAASVFGNGLSGGTEVEFRGAGGGGAPYANFYKSVKSVYTHAWILPDSVADDDAMTEVSVTISRDGTVAESHITKFSGNSAVDHSVQATLDRVTYAAPLPESAKENKLQVTIYFSAKAKRGLG